LSFDHVLPEMAEAAALGVGAARSRVRLLLPSGAEELACWPPGGQVGDSFDRVIPVAHHGETVGEIAITKPRGEQVSKQDETLLRDLASEAGMAMSSLRLTDELKQRLVDLQESRRRIVSAHDEERRRMERDLHDGAQQQLVGIKIKLGLVKALLPDPPEGVGELLEGIVQDTSATVGTLRDLARGLFPEVLVQRGLVAAVDTHVEKSGLDAEVASDPSVGRYDIEIESNVYFIVREALQNTSKYAPGAHSTITLGETDDGLVFVVSDDGPGFDATTITLGSGTQNMRDRVEVLGGVLEVTSTPGAGTTVRGTIPLRTAIAGVVDARSDADTQEQTIDLNRTRTAAAT
jgi:signal transduction histidine kinase